MKHKDLQDLIGGVLLSAVGLFFALYSQRYDLGTAARMGPGYFPTVLGWTLTVLGVLVALPALFRKGPPVKIQLGNFLFVMAALLLFAFSLRSLGMVAATFLASFVASLADRDITWKGRALMSAGVTVLTVLVFSVGLNMVLPLWWWNA
ncbi:tripartite tricarboxylate transporter TctB family protein [Caldimonas sp.]|uniref:tripartite tricarboxylate transporter TctB family protein n=1 Tax=Caldimonas sp. TaxID=2838790 RepID=UPI00391BF25D